MAPAVSYRKKQIAVETLSRGVKSGPQIIKILKRIVSESGCYRIIKGIKETNKPHSSVNELKTSLKKA